MSGKETELLDRVKRIETRLTKFMATLGVNPYTKNGKVVVDGVRHIVEADRSVSLITMHPNVTLGDLLQYAYSNGVSGTVRFYLGSQSLGKLDL